MIVITPPRLDHAPGLGWGGVGVGGYFIPVESL